MESFFNLELLVFVFDVNCKFFCSNNLQTRENFPDHDPERKAP